MKNISKALRSILLANIMIALTACSTLGPTPAPTQDQAALVKMVVATMDAQMIETERAKPTATLVPTSTETPLPTNTLPPTETLIPSLTPVPSATSDQVQGIGAKFLSAVTFPKNSLEYTPNETFGIEIAYKNVGTVTWVAGYKIKISSFVGTLTAHPEETLDKNVAPGEVGRFEVSAFGSEQLGKHTFVYQLYTETGLPVRGGLSYFSYTSH
jgi:hypothetical protein